MPGVASGRAIQTQNGDCFYNTKMVIQLALSRTERRQVFWQLILQLVVTLTMRESGIIGLIFPKPTVVMQAKAS